VVNETDMLRLFHEDGLSLAYIPQLIQSATAPFIKKLLLTQLVSIIFSKIFRSEIHNLQVPLPSR
jgi:tetratricopeptide (TPR) repeat protein